MTSWRATQVCALAAALWSGAAWAVSFKLASTGGVMQQPTSHYYHAVYGAYGQVGRDDDRFVARAQYVERPEFSSAGYVDKDYGAFALIGTRLTKGKAHGLSAFFGAGRMLGYVRAVGATADQSTIDRRTYDLPGPSAAVEYAYRWKRLDVAINHQTFVGYVDETQAKAYVAWPYNFFQATVGWLW